MPKSKVRKKNDFTINPVSRTPVKVKAGPSSVWFVVLFCRLDVDRPGRGCWCSSWRHQPDSRLPHWMANLGPWNYAIAFAFMITGLVAHDALAVAAPDRDEFNLDFRALPVWQPRGHPITRM